jgi:hypothetical protein
LKIQNSISYSFSSFGPVMDATHQSDRPNWPTSQWRLHYIRFSIPKMYYAKAAKATTPAQLGFFGPTDPLH